MIDFSKYTLQELQAMSDLLDYLREDAGADALSYFCSCSMLHAIKRESIRLSRSILMSLEQQARDAAEPAGDPPDPDMFGWVGDALDDLCASVGRCKKADILVRGMEMPQSCMDCRLNYGEKRPEHGLTIVCKYSNGVVFPEVTGIVGRLPTCGLLELPEHGDLVDLDERVIKQVYDDYNKEWNMKTMTIRQCLNIDDADMPVIIPSNKGVGFGDR